MWTDNLKHFHFWCQKVLPLVYDDSLSYYEVLCKITEHLNRLTTLVNEIGDELERYEGVTDTRLDNLETWRTEVDTWRANIDIWQGQINSWKSGIDTWKGDIDTWKQTVTTWITDTVEPFITATTERVEDIEATLSDMVNTVLFQAERSTKIIPVTLHYDTSNNQFYLQEVITPLGGGRYPFEQYLTSRSLDTDAVTNGSNLVFSIRDFYVDASTRDNQFPPSSMTTATSKTVKIKKATLYGGGYVQYNGQDVYFELDTQNIQTIYDPMDFYSPLLMYAPKTNTDDRPHRIVWLPRDQYVYGTAERIGVVEQREAVLESKVVNNFVRATLTYDNGYIVKFLSNDFASRLKDKNLGVSNNPNFILDLILDNTAKIQLQTGSNLERITITSILDSNNNILQYNGENVIFSTYNEIGLFLPIGYGFNNGTPSNRLTARYVSYLNNTDNIVLQRIGARYANVNISSGLVDNEILYPTVAIGNGLSLNEENYLEGKRMVLNATGGTTGGNFIDIGNPIVQPTDYDSAADVTYTAQSNCVLIARMLASNGSAATVKLNNVEVFRLYFSSGTNESSYTLYLKTGQTATLHTPELNYKSSYAVYPITN